MFLVGKAVEQYRGGGHDRVDVIPGDRACALVIADGMGGRSGAAQAAQIWIDAVLGGSRERHRWLDTDHWLELMAATDRAVADDPKAGETTALVAVIAPEGVFGASVGDSGGWLITADSYLDLTKSQMRKPGLGTRMAMPVPFYRKPLPPGATLLVATDGLLKYTSPQRICEAVRASRDLKLLPESLIDLVRMPSGGLQDDVAAAVARQDVEVR